MAGIAEAARARFESHFGKDRSPRVAVAPGRVNLIGEHTDYNEGFVLPMAINRGVAVAFARREDGVLAHPDAFGKTRELAIGSLSPPGGTDVLAYVAGVAWAMKRAGLPVCGLELSILGDLSVGAGLGSSAAFEMAAARALCAATGTDWDPPLMARIGQQAENEFVGVACGIMDQFASAACTEGCALLLDCRTLETRAVPLPESATVAVMDTGVRRSLTETAYNERRAACQRAVGLLQRLEPRVRSLRDADELLLLRAPDLMDSLTYRRARHVIPEIQRPPAMAEALTIGDLARAGHLMNDSHASLRDLYEVSSPELDAMVNQARKHPACFGARLTGAGFGGCAIALVSTAEAASFMEHVRTRYREVTGIEGDFFTSRAAAGARLLD